MKWFRKIFSLDRLYAICPAFDFSSVDLNILQKEIHQQIKSKSIFLKFSKTLEDIFQKENMPVKLRRYFIFGFVSIVIYNLVCITDYLTLTSLFSKILILRLLIVTPVLIIISFSIFIPAFHKYIEYVIGIIVGILIIHTIIILDYCHYSDICFYNIVWMTLIPPALNIILRVNFFHALIYSAIIFIFQLLMISIKYYRWPASMTVNLILYHFMIIVISIIANYYITKRKRGHFLNKMLLQINSISLEKANQELTRLSNMDNLTGLKNRGYFDDIIEQEWRSAVREKKPVSLIFIDIDYFKKYNDNYGHQSGDKCIKLIADIIRQYSRRPLDLCARYGGEEFVILLPHLTLKEAVEHAERIKKSISNLNIKHSFSDVSSSVTVSLGVAGIVPVKNTSPDLLIKAADRALYKAKANGRNKVEIQEI